MHTTNLSIAKQYELLEQTINALEEQNAILKSILEKTMTPAEKEEASKLHKKVSKTGFIDQYGKEKGEKVYYATMQKQAMKKA